MKVRNVNCPQGQQCQTNLWNTMEEEVNNTFEGYDKTQQIEEETIKNNTNQTFSCQERQKEGILPQQNTCEVLHDVNICENNAQLLTFWQNPFDININPWKKTKIISKIHEILQRKFQSSQNGNNLSSPNPQNASQETIKFNKPFIDKAKLLQLKAAFDEYHKRNELPEAQAPTIPKMAQKFNLSIQDVQSLYVEYVIDPNFTQRIQKFELQENGKGYDAQALTEIRVQFLQELIKRRGPLTEGQIMAEMCKVDFLHQYSRGKMIPLSRKTIQQVMKLSHVLPRMIPSLQKVPSSEETILNRFNYARRYLEITSDRNAEICFIGEYSFSNNFSLSGCPIGKRETFVNFEAGKLARKPIKIIPKQEDVVDKWGRNLQILVAMSLYGIIHYKLYSNIFEECNFLKTVLSIAKKMQIRKPYHNKYLILETNFFHSKQALRRMEKMTSIKTIFLPPQTPMLNPTEYFFNQLRQVVKSKAYKQHRAFGAIATEYLESMREGYMQCHFMSIRPYLQLALRRQSYK